MAEFQPDFQSFKPSIPLLDITDQNMVLTNQFQDLNNLQSLMAFSNDNFFCPQEAEFPGNLADNFPAIFQHCHWNSIPDSQPAVVPKNEFHESKKRKEIDVSESSSGISSTPLSDAGIKSKNSSRRKRAKSNIDEKEEEKPKDVVHVRARRGQATDSHSLAERVRRGKINEKLRCLQDIVPGCYKTMGMSVMLDEIINYVQSLQTQVEFLSMKLTAASTFYDFNSETDAIETMQRAKAYEAQEMERLMRVRGHGGHGSMHSTWSL